MNTASQTYWVRLYAVERAGAHYFVYGYAASAGGILGSWKMSNLKVSGSSWKLNQYNCFVGENEIKRLQEAAENGAIGITVGTQQLVLVSSRLVHRPRVMAVPHEAHISDRPKSFSEDMAEMESHWELDKFATLDRAFPNADFTPEAAQDVSEELLARLESETGIKFKSEDAGRFGNLDVFHHLSGDFRIPDGLCCRSLRTKLKGGEQLSMLVWLEPPVRDAPDLVVGCRLFNGGGSGSRTCVFNEIRPYRFGEKLNFAPKEPFSLFEVSVWSNHRLVGYRTFHIVRSIAFNMHVNDRLHRVRTKWSEEMPSELRDRAERIPSGISQNSVIGSGTADPWRDAELVARNTVQACFSKNASGHYFENNVTAQLESIEVISRMILRSEVRRVIIADPFFDDIGVQSLLVKVQESKEVVILASHTTNSGGKARLAAECERLRRDLPKIVSVINIETPGEATQQFHDRYILIEMEKDSNIDSELWMLSNSFSSMAKNYPLVVVMLPPNIAVNVAEYIRNLEKGKPPGKNRAIRTIVWTKTESSPKPKPVPPATSGFEGSDTLLALLVSDLQLLVDWRVPPDALQAVIGAVKRAIETDSSRRTEHICMIAHWHYHGGPNPSEYAFEAPELEWLAEAFRQMLISDSNLGGRFEVEILQDDTELPEALESIWYWVNQMPFEIRRSTNPALHFFAESLWESAPHLLTGILDETKNSSLFCWLCMEGSGAGEAQVQHLLAARSSAVKALGIVLLHENCKREAKMSGGIAVVLLKAKLIGSSVHKNEIWWALVFIEARMSGGRKLVAQPFSESAKAWPISQLSEQELKRLTSLLDRARPNQAIKLVNQLADACPLPADQQALHQWCIDQLLSQVPLKSALAVQQEGIRFWLNAETILAAAHSVWEIHGDGSGEWFRSDVLSKLKLSNAQEPLLRTRNYSKWSGAVDGIVLALWFGRAVSEKAPNLQRSGDAGIVLAPLMAQMVVALGPEVWRAYVHKNDQLQCILAFVGWSAEYCDEASLMEIVHVVNCDWIPSIWRLWLIVQSPKLLLRYAALVDLFSKEPIIGMEQRGYDSIDLWWSKFDKSLTHLEAQISQELRESRLRHLKRRPCRANQKVGARVRASNLRGSIHTIRENLTQWKLGFSDCVTNNSEIQ